MLREIGVSGCIGLAAAPMGAIFHICDSAIFQTQVANVFNKQFDNSLFWMPRYIAVPGDIESAAVSMGAYYS